MILGFSLLYMIVKINAAMNQAIKFLIGGNPFSVQIHILFLIAKNSNAISKININNETSNAKTNVLF
jgi:hypothetical protein